MLLELVQYNAEQINDIHLDSKTEDSQTTKPQKRIEFSFNLTCRLQDIISASHLPLPRSPLVSIRNCSRESLIHTTKNPCYSIGGLAIRKQSCVNVSRKEFNPPMELLHSQEMHSNALWHFHRSATQDIIYI